MKPVAPVSSTRKRSPDVQISIWPQRARYAPCLCKGTGGKRHSTAGPAALAAGAAGITAVAAVTDFKLIPERLTPGFEHRLSTRSLVLTYALFATGLALGAIATRRSR